MTLQGQISIVIPCFNHGPTLLETLASIERVRIDSLAEVIIVNDGSTDPATCDILDRLDTKKYIVVHQENRGPSAARNAAIEIARGEFILPLDSDNLIRRAYLDCGTAILMARADAGVVYGDPQFFGERNGRDRIAEFDWTLIVRRNYIDTCALYRRSIWESVGGYDEEMRLGYEDWDFWMRIGLRGWKFVHLDEVGFDYRTRMGSRNSIAERRHQELAEIIFVKPEYEFLKILREQSLQAEKLPHILGSWDYRIGSSIVAPLRRVKRLLTRSHQRSEPHAHSAHARRARK